MKLEKIKELIRATSSNDLEDIDVLHLSKSLQGAKEYTLFFYNGDSDSFAFTKEELESASIVGVVSEGEIRTSLPVLRVKHLQRAYATLYHALCGSPTDNLMMIGIAGSKGKSSTIAALTDAFETLNLPLGIIEQERFSLGTFTMPVTKENYQTEELCRMLTSVAKGEAEYCLLEVPLRQLMADQLYGIQYKLAMYTSTEVDEFNEDYDQEGGYESVKSMFLASEMSVVNMGDQWGQRLYEALQSQGRCVYSYGMSQDFDIHANDVTFWGNKTEFELVTPEGRYPMVLKVPGRINLLNALGVAAALYALESDEDEALKAVESIKGREGLLQVVPNYIGLNIFVDVAKEPRTILDRLDTVREITKGKIISVVGCNDVQAIESLQAVIEVASSESDLLIFTTGNWQNKSPKEVKEGIFSTWKVPDNVMILDDREAALQTAVEVSDTKDAIVIFGRGTETIIQHGDERIYFDDIATINAAIERK